MLEEPRERWVEREEAQSRKPRSLTQGAGCPQGGTAGDEGGGQLLGENQPPAGLGGSQGPARAGSGEFQRWASASGSTGRPVQRRGCPQGHAGMGLRCPVPGRGEEPGFEGTSEIGVHRINPAERHKP